MGGYPTGRTARPRTAAQSALARLSSKPGVAPIMRRSQRDLGFSGATRLSSRIAGPGDNSAGNRVSPTARPANLGNAQLATSLTPADRIRVMITKDFIIAKTFRSYRANFFRHDKSLRDHGGPPRRPMLSTVT
jgi:hypothetical protein